MNGSGQYTSDLFTAIAVGTYRWVATYSGDADNSPAVSACGDPAETVAVTPPQPLTMTTLAAVSGPGAPLSDTAVLSGGVNPTGTVTFYLYGPDDPTCARPPVSTSVGQQLPGFYVSQPFFPLLPGTYRWVATYSGDANNPAVTTACDDPAETVVVFPPPNTTLTTETSPSAVVGSPVGDVAHLSSANNPTGTLSFLLFGPDDPTCARTPIYTAPPVIVMGSGRYVVQYTVAVPGTYQWVAIYSGDAHNDFVATACGDPAETVVVTPPPPVSLETHALGGSPANPLSDTAFLLGGVSPTGTLTFDLYGPDDTTCSQPPLFTRVKAVTGAGGYNSDAINPPGPGTYRWVVTYSGDANNLAIGPTPCGDPTETVVVKPPKQGSLTICVAKANGATGDYTFTVEDQTVTVAAGQCSPTIRVFAGPVTVTEAPSPGFLLARCTTIPTGRVQACRRTAGEAVVRVAAGGVAKQTILTITNRRVR